MPSPLDTIFLIIGISILIIGISIVLRLWFVALAREDKESANEIEAFPYGTKVRFLTGFYNGQEGMIEEVDARDCRYAPSFTIRLTNGKTVQNIGSHILKRKESHVESN